MITKVAAKLRNMGNFSLKNGSEGLLLGHEVQGTNARTQYFLATKENLEQVTELSTESHIVLPESMTTDGLLRPIQKAKLLPLGSAVNSGIESLIRRAYLIHLFSSLEGQRIPKDLTESVVFANTDLQLLEGLYWNRNHLDLREEMRGTNFQFEKRNVWSKVDIDGVGERMVHAPRTMFYYPDKKILTVRWTLGIFRGDHLITPRFDWNEVGEPTKAEDMVRTLHAVLVYNAHYVNTGHLTLRHMYAKNEEFKKLFNFYMEMGLMKNGIKTDMEWHEMNDAMKNGKNEELVQ